eukprot:TRINITY_DN2616_c0_g1_i1.p1 TRINITY_DN2616_c0_g1~~TRINITY_DN2616_c0_g1_i1.p1  ORF type:complete len:164 (-),score=15.17 TRINITY_DN2616_c0_g1_i1:758-1249(-)
MRLLFALIALLAIWQASAQNCTHTNCGDCVTGSGILSLTCGWCTLNGGFCLPAGDPKTTPPAGAPPYGCNGDVNSWKIGQCVFNTVIIIAICCGVGALIILIIVICCCCYCSRKRRERLAKEQLLDDNAEMDYYRHKPVEETAPKTTAKRRELEEKYGIRPRQ